MSFSYFPVRFMTGLGGVYAGSCYLGDFTDGTAADRRGGRTGWASMMVLMLFSFGVTMVMLGILGEYVYLESL